MSQTQSANSVFPIAETSGSGSETAPESAEGPPPIKVALDLRLISNSGIGNYLRGLLRGFAEIQAPIEWTFIGPECSVPAGLRVVEWVAFDARPYSREEFQHYPKLPPTDLFHYPHYNLPLGARRPAVVTVYDLFHLLYGTFAKRLYQRFFLFRLAQSNARIIAISEKTREDLERKSSIETERITVVELGPGRPLPGAGSKRPASLHDPGRGNSPVTMTLPSGRAIEGPWFLAAGIDKAHKNMDFLIAAMALWYRRRPNAPPLIWTGLQEEDLAERTGSIPAHARGNIHLAPYLSDEDTERLYSGAIALVFPSLDEGFGFPPLEAMARRVPVLCSRRRPMTDLLGNAPLWFDPRDSATLWRGLDRLLDERGLHHEAAERGLRQAAKYSWAETARKTLDVYRSALPVKT